MSKFAAKRVLITGGASGIGRIMGRMALEHGAEVLIVWDINRENLDRVLSEFAPLGAVYGYTVDISDTQAVEECYNRVKRDVGRVDILINNAGIVTSNSTFDRLSIDEILRTMTINATAQMVVVYAPSQHHLTMPAYRHICSTAHSTRSVCSLYPPTYAV